MRRFRQRPRSEPDARGPRRAVRLQGEEFYGDFVCDAEGPEILSRPSGGRPTEGIRVEFLQDTKTWTLTNVASGEDLAFDTTELDVAAEAEPGES